MKLNDTPQTLHDLFRQIARDFGENVMTESRLKGLLGDLGGTVVDKYRHVISRSINYQLGEKLLLLRELDEADFALKLGNIRQMFQEENFFRHDIANYIVDCYLFAFEWTDKVEECSNENSSSDSAKPGELSFAKHSDLDYCGNLNGDDERSGFGISKDEEGNYYAGEWKLNLKNGIGIDVSMEHSKYAGEWRLNRRAGIGVEILPDGKRYAGEWKNGMRNGSGILFYPNGERMYAIFYNGQPETGLPGIYYLKDGSHVVGNMTANGPDGECDHFYLNGTHSQETWENGKLKNV